MFTVDLIDALTITTTIQRVCENNPARTSIGFYNNGSNTVYLSANPTAGIADGWPIPGGCSVVFNLGLGDNPTLAFYALTASGTSDLRVMRMRLPREA